MEQAIGKPSRSKQDVVGDADEDESVTTGVLVTDAGLDVEPEPATVVASVLETSVFEFTVVAV